DGPKLGGREAEGALPGRVDLARAVERADGHHLRGHVEDAPTFVLRPMTPRELATEREIAGQRQEHREDAGRDEDLQRGRRRRFAAGAAGQELLLVVDHSVEDLADGVARLRPLHRDRRLGGDVVWTLAHERYAPLPERA